MGKNVVGCMSQLSFVQAFMRLCDDGWHAGYHECNGGNASYLLSDSDCAAAQPFFNEHAGHWNPLVHAVPDMGGSFLLVTGSGKFLRNVVLDVAANAGIVELSHDGSQWRTLWGLRDDARPTSELSAHVAALAVRNSASCGGASCSAEDTNVCPTRVMYHAHPTSVVAFSAVVPADACTVTRLLWKTFSESIVAFPEGVAVIPWMPPGSAELAVATQDALRQFPACIWQHHGVFAAGATFDQAFGVVSAIDKAADAYLRIQAVRSGKEEIHVSSIPDSGLLETAKAYCLPVRKDFLSEALAQSE